MAERLNNINEQISISDLYERAENDGNLTSKDYENKGINIEEEGGLMVLPNDLVVQTDRRVNLNSVTDTGSQIIERRSVMSIDISRDEDEIRVKNENGVEIVIEHDNSEMYRRRDKSNISYRKSYFERNSALLESTDEKDRHYLKASALVENIRGERFRRGFTSEESIVKRFTDENGKWPAEKNMRKYVALTRVNFTFELKNNGGRRSTYFDVGETFLAPKSFEDLEKKAEMDKKLKK